MTTHNLDELNEIEVPTFGDNEGDGLARIWWKYGNQPAKIAGHFYTRADDWAGAPPEPWVECELYEGEIGYKAEVLRLLLITKRAQPYVKVKQGDKEFRRYVDWPARGGEWPTGMQIHTEFLCLAEGLGAPVVFSFHGATGTAMEAKGGIIPSANKALAAEASKLYKRKIGLSAFWLPIGPELNAQGKTNFVKLAQGSVINSPALRLPSLEGKALLQACYAGKERIAEATALREQYDLWRQERRGDEAPTGVTQAAPAGRNAPQELSDADFDDIA